MFKECEICHCCISDPHLSIKVYYKYTKQLISLYISVYIYKMHIDDRDQPVNYKDSCVHIYHYIPYFYHYLIFILLIL